MPCTENDLLINCLFKLPKAKHSHEKIMTTKTTKTVKKKKTCLGPKGKNIDIWWNNLLTGVSHEDVWKKNFRMKREEFFELCDGLRPHISPVPNSPNYKAISAEKELAITLYSLKDTGSMWMTANTFGVHQSTVTKVIVQVCSAITDHLLVLSDKNHQKLGRTCWRKGYSLS